MVRLGARLDENRARLESTRQKLDVLVEDDAPSRAEEGWTIPELSIREEDVEVAYLREKQKRSQP